MNPKKDVTIVNQPFDMNLFLKRQVDAAAAMTYNELAQVLETKNPKTGKLYQLERPERHQDGRRRHGDARGRHLRPRRLDQGQGQPGRSASGSSPPSFKGWIYCRDHYEECMQIVLDNGPTLGKGHQTWQMNEINALIWPNTRRDRRHGPGRVQADGQDRAAVQVIKKPADVGRVPHRPRAGRPSTSSKKQGIDVNGNGLEEGRPSRSLPRAAK